MPVDMLLSTHGAFDRFSIRSQPTFQEFHGHRTVPTNNPYQLHSKFSTVLDSCVSTCSKSKYSQRCFRPIPTLLTSQMVLLVNLTFAARVQSASIHRSIAAFHSCGAFLVFFRSIPFVFSFTICVTFVMLYEHHQPSVNTITALRTSHLHVCAFRSFRQIFCPSHDLYNCTIVCFPLRPWASLQST